jgi:hypothetical protein
MDGGARLPKDPTVNQRAGHADAKDVRRSYSRAEPWQMIDHGSAHVAASGTSLVGDQ